MLYVKVECQHFQDAEKNVVWLLVSYDLFTFQNGLVEQKLSLKQNSYFPATPIPQCAIWTHRGFHGNVGFCRFFSGLKPPVLIYLLQEGTLTLTHENLQRKTIKRIGQLLIHSILNNCRPIKILYLDRLFESFVQLEH